MRFSQGNDVVDASDVEVTLVHNEIPERPATSLRPWHVHLELRPEQLVALHRLGFTGGALAWREGMDEWQPLRDGGEPAENDEESSANTALATVTPLAEARRRNQRENSPPAAAHGGIARITPFARARANVPPIAGALPVPLVRVRHMTDRPPPPSIELAKGPLPSFAADAIATLPPILSHSPTYAMMFEPKPTSVPPMALESAADPPRRGLSRAVLLGAAALVTLAASNGVLASALVWSLRNEPARAEPLPSSAVAAQPPAPPLEAPPVSLPDGKARPLSVEQLPLVTSVHASRTSTNETLAHSPATRASGSGDELSSRKRNRRAVRDDETPAPRKPSKNAQAPSTEPPDRRAVARAVARAAGAAATCAPGPEKGRVSLTFAPSGNVQAVSLLQGFGDTGINSCVLRAMGRARVQSFSGEPVTVQKTLTW